MGGGIPEGDSLLVAGPSGAGKTVLVVNNTPPSFDPDQVHRKVEDAYAMLRGLRTLPTRMARQGASGLTVAAWLREHTPDPETTLVVSLDTLGSGTPFTIFDDSVAPFTNANSMVSPIEFLFGVNWSPQMAIRAEQAVARS